MARTQITAEPGLPQILITREFDATRELLFRAHIDPALLAQWLGPRWLTTTIDRFDPQHGGIWHYIRWDPEGGEYAFGGASTASHPRTASFRPSSLRAGQVTSPSGSSPSPNTEARPC